MLMCGAQKQPNKLLRKSRFIHIIGKQNDLPSIDAALRRARELHEPASPHAVGEVKT